MRFDERADDPDHTADSLKSGEVQAAVTSEPKPAQGCRAASVGAMRYFDVCTPRFAGRYGLALAGSRRKAESIHRALAAAPCLLFNRKDRLQHRFMGAADEPAHEHYLPSAEGFAHPALGGLGWGMCPQAICSDSVLTCSGVRLGT